MKKEYTVIRLLSHRIKQSNKFNSANKYHNDRYHLVFLSLTYFKVCTKNTLNYCVI